MTTTLLRGGHVYAPERPDATAMLLQDASVLWVGDDDAALTHLDTADDVVALDGALVTPAFVDAHVHATATGLTLDGLDLTGSQSRAEALRRVERFARERRGRPVLGHGWDESSWLDRRPPSAAELDRASYGGVVYLSRTDKHSAVVSSALLAAAPQSRSLDGYVEGEPLTRDAHHAVREAAFATLGREGRRQAQRATRRRAALVGIGAVHEIAGPVISGADDLTEFLALSTEEAGPDAVGYWGEIGGARRARDLGASGAAGDLFVDGSIGSHTACLSEPYADAETTGYSYLDVPGVCEHVVECSEVGVQAGFHVIGDAAVRAVVEGFAAAAEVLGVDRLVAGRHRVEHVEMLDPHLVSELARLGVIASVQPAFDAAWGGTSGMYVDRLGADRAATLNPFASMAAAGVVLAFGSDAPVTPLDPWGTVRAAAYHHVEAERLTVQAAFAAHTVGGWRAAGRDDAGLLRPGAPATFALWQHDGLGRDGLPDLADPAVRPVCLRTVIRGRTVHELEGALP